MPWQNGVYWTIHDEKDYLKHLGTRTWSKEVKTSRRELLESYLETIDWRKESWVSKAKAYARELLEEEYGKDR